MIQQARSFRTAQNLQRTKSTPDTDSVLFPNIGTVNSKRKILKRERKGRGEEVIYYSNISSSKNLKIREEIISPIVTPPQRSASSASRKNKICRQNKKTSDTSEKKKHVKFEDKNFEILRQRKEKSLNVGKKSDPARLIKKKTISISTEQLTKNSSCQSPTLNSGKCGGFSTKSNNTYPIKRRIVEKPTEPFKVFLDSNHSLARIVWLYLLECRLPFEKIPITAKQRDKVRLVPAFSNHCIFVDGETTLGQETAIIRYLTLNYTRNLFMGTDISQISQSFSWIHWAASVLYRDLYYLTDGEMMKGVKSILQSSKRQIAQSSMDSVSLYLDMLEKILSERDFLLGSYPWFCDSVLALVLEDARTFSLKSWPSVLRWLDRIREHNTHWEKVTES